MLGLLTRIVAQAGVTALEYRDERGPRCVTGQGSAMSATTCPLPWTQAGPLPGEIDLTLWLHDPHLNVTRWHEELRERITAEQRSAVLRIDDVALAARLSGSGRRPGHLHRRDR